jgi:hypothetical protein
MYSYPQTYYYQPTVPQYQYQYQYQVGNQAVNQYQYIQYLTQLIAQLQALLQAQQGLSFMPSVLGNSLIDITTNSADDIENDEARLRGTVDFNSSDEAFVWFQWGEDSDLDEETPRVGLDDGDDEDFTIRITDLDRDAKYYFRAVGEDEDGQVDYGATRTFTTDDNGGGSDDDEPNVNTGEADQIDSDSARINGYVDMNDFDNGIVFFVYGEDENQVSDIEDDYDTYNDVDEDGDDLQKIKVDSGLDDDADYTASMSGLNDNTDHYYRICVQYEDEDNDDVISCGSVENFETD